MDEVREESLSRLIEAWKSGIRADESFSALFRRFYRRVYNTFPSSHISAETRHELTQDVFFKVHKHRESCPVEAFEVWLLRIARTTFLSWFERAGRMKRRGQEVSWDDLDDAEPRHDDLPPLEQMLERERSEALRRATEALPDRMRQCVLLRIYQGMSEAEIAAALRMAPGTVKAHLHAARTRLRERLAEEIPEIGSTSRKEGDR